MEQSCAVAEKPKAESQVKPTGSPNSQGLRQGKEKPVGTIAGNNWGQPYEEGGLPRAYRSSSLPSKGRLYPAYGSLGNASMLLKDSSVLHLPSHTHTVIYVGATFSSRAHVIGTNIIFW